MNCVRSCALVAGLCLVALGLFLSERPDQTRLGLGHKDCIDPASPSLDGPPASVTFVIQPDQFVLRHSGEVKL